MSDIDLSVSADGDDGINRLTSSIDRLVASMESMSSSPFSVQLKEMQTASTAALTTLSTQMQDMQRVLATGFADISATGQKLLAGVGTAQVRQIEVNGEKAVAAMAEATAKMTAAQRADAATLLQASRGSAANVEKAFASLSAGGSVEAVRSYYGEIATETARGFKTLDDMIQFRANAKSVKTLQYDPRAGATEAQLQEAAALNARFDAERLAAQERLGAVMAAAAVAEMERIDTIQMKRNESAAQALADQVRLGEAMAAATVAELERIDTIQMKRNEEAAQAVTAQYRLGEAMAAATLAELERVDTIQMKRNEAAAQAIQDEYRRGEAMAAATVAELERIDTIKLKRHEAAMQAIEDEKLKNASYIAASPSSQIHTQIRAASLGQVGLDPAQFVGTQAAADAQGKSIAQLRAELAALRTSSIETGAAQLELSGALKQAEGAFRGAAHQAGIYGLHHGQLIGLLAGGALAAALHHIAETGAEVEMALATFPALAGAMNAQPVDMDKFIGIGSGTIVGLKDAAEGMAALAEAGMKAHQAMAMLPDVMRLAAVGNMSVAQAAEMAVESMHAFGYTATEIEHVGDVLVAVASMANVSVHTLSEDMKSAATSGQMFGMSMEETAATVGVLAERGLTIQPLSSALMKIYEPSAKGAAAIKQLGLEVRNAETGAFRPFTEVMDDLSKKMNTFSDSGITDTFKAIGFSARDIKSIQVMTADHEKFEHILDKTKESSGLMFDAMAVKSNTVEGAFKILGSTVDGVFARAFRDAEPVIRQVEDDLQQITGSSDMQSFISGIATGFANLAHSILENRGAIEMAVAGYVGLRLVPPIIEAVTAAQVFLFGSTTLATAAVAGEGVAATVAGTQLDLFAVGEGAAATGATTLAVEAGVAEVVLGGVSSAAAIGAAVLGPLGIAIAAVGVAFALFHGPATKAETANTAMNNSIDSTIESMDKELERLDLLKKELALTGKTGEESAYQVQEAFAKMSEANAKAALDIALAANKGPRKLEAGDDGTLTAFEQTESGGDAVAAQKAYDLAHKRAEDLATKHAKILEDREKVKSGNDIQDLETKAKALPYKLEGLEATNPEKAKALRAEVEELSKRNITVDNYVQSLADEKRLEAEISASKLKGITPPEKGEYKANVSALQEQLTLAKQLRDTELKDLASANKRGELGDLQLINEQLRVRLEYDQKAVTIAEKEKAAAIAGGAKPGEVQKYQNKILTAEGQKDADESTAARARADMFDKMETMQLHAHAQTLAKQGLLDDAFDEEWLVKNSKLLENNASDIEAIDQKILQAKSSKMRESLELQKAAFVATKDMYEQLRKEGHADAVFKMDVSQFDQDLAHMKAGLADLARQNGPGTGLSSIVSHTFAQRDVMRDALPGLKAQALQARADAGNDPQKIQQAEAMLTKVKDEAANLNNIFVSLGQTIATSLTNAFGTAGSAMGGLITTATAYGAKMASIKSELADSDGGADAQKAAAEATASAQIKAYSDMAGAASGFFDKNSKGYKTLHAAEQAFRVFELAMAMGNAVKKIALDGGVTTAVVANTTARTVATIAGEEGGVAAVEASVGPTVAANMEKGQSAAVAGVAGQAQGDPYSAFARMAVMAAAMAALGFAVGGVAGGSADTLAADRQAKQGTGTVLGDGTGTAKSDSIARSIAMTAENSATQINYLASMAASLSALQANISSFASVLMRSTDIMNPQTGVLKGTSGTATTIATNIFGGPLGAFINKSIPILGKITDKISSTLFGGKQSLIDSGFEMGYTSMAALKKGQANVNTYADIKTSGGWFSSDKTSEKKTSAGDEVNRQISGVIVSLGDVAKQAGLLLGFTGDAIDKSLNEMTVSLGHISLKGLSSDDAQKQLNAVFSSLGDSMASAMFPFVKAFKLVGEGDLDTLSRLATDYAKIDASLASVGMAFGSIGVSSLDAREDLVKLSGGIDKFQTNTASFASNFLTKAQQQAPVLSFVNQEMSKLNLGWVKTREDFAKVVAGLNLTSPAARETYTALMGLQDAFAATHAAIVDTSKTAQDIADERKDLQTQYDEATMTSIELLKKQRDALDASNRALFDQVTQAKAISQAKSSLNSAYQTESSAIQSAVDRLKSFSLGLRNFVNTLQLGNLSPLAPIDKYAAAMAQYNTTLAKAKAGDTTAQSGLQSAAQAFLQASQAANASNSTYQNDYQSVVSATTQLATWADGQVTEGQANLALLHDQVEGLTTLNESVLSVVDAINNLAIVNTHGTDAEVNKRAIDTLYEELLGRNATAADEAHWHTVLAAGTSLASIATDLKSTPEYFEHLNKLPTSPNTVDSSTTTYGYDAPHLNDPHLTAATDSVLIDRMRDMFHNLSQGLLGLRQDAQTQSDQQVAATMTAGNNTGEKVATAITTTAQQTAWTANNTMELR